MSLAIAYRMKKSKGGEVKGVHRVSPASLTGGESEAGLTVRGPKPVGGWKGSQPQKHSKEEHKRILGEMRSMKGPHGNYADGGMLTDDGYQSTCDEHCNYPCDVHMGDVEGFADGGKLRAKWSEDDDEDGRRGGWTMPGGGRHNTGAYIGGKPAPGHGAVITPMKKLDMKTGEYSMHGPKGRLPKACGGVVDRVMAKRMAKGGSADNEPSSLYLNEKDLKGTHRTFDPSRGVSMAGHAVRAKHEWAKQEHRRVLAEMKADKQDRRYMSEGGKVANTDELTAGFEPNEFDDLHLRDDLESEYTGENSGDELGNEGEDGRRRDIVSRIMRSRAKRAGHNPRPA